METSAPVAYLVDLSSGAVLLAKEADKRIPPASMTKMLTAHLVFDMLRKGEVKLSQTYTMRPDTWAQWHGPNAGATMYLRSGETVSLKNLLHGMITLSANDATIMLAEGIAGTQAAFVAQMNAKAKALGLTGSHFNTPNGWPDGGKTYSTARDLARLAEATLRQHPDFYRAFYGQPRFAWGKGPGGKPIEQNNRNPLLGRIKGADGIKTGHTKEAGFTLTGSAQQGGRRLLMVVAGLPSYETRVAESIKIMTWGFEAWTAKPVFPAGHRLAAADVQQGAYDRVPLMAEAIRTVTLPAGSAHTFKARIVYDGPLKAPIRMGQQVATLIIKADGLPEQISPLYAAAPVLEAGFLRRMWLGFLSLTGVN